MIQSFTGFSRKSRCVFLFSLLTVAWTLLFTATSAGANGQSIFINDVAVAEGNTGVTNAVFTVTISAPRNAPQEILFQTRERVGNNGVARAGEDYGARTGSLTIPAGATTGTIAVPVFGDTKLEQDESFLVVLTLSAEDAQTYQSIKPGGYCVIANDDAGVLPTLAINDATILEGNSGLRDVVLTITLSSASTLPVTMDYATNSSTAASPADFPARSGTSTIAAGQTTGTITVQVSGDTLDENDEQFSIILTNASNAYFVDAVAVVTIRDDDPANPSGPLPTLSIKDVTVREGDGGTDEFNHAGFIVTLSAVSDRMVWVEVIVSSGTATAQQDFAPVSTNLLVFHPGETSRGVRMLIKGDTVAELAENFFVDLKRPVNATISDSRGIGRIIDNDGPIITIDNAKAVTEGNSGTTAQNFTVRLSAASTNTVTVDWATANGPSNAGAGPADFTAASGRLTFAPGETQKTITVQVKGDTTVEPNERYFVNLSRPTLSVIYDSQGSAYIINDDSAPGLIIQDAPSG